ncbi:hypothetical protein B0H19DRAFT_1099093 [Mycena capillaripes]|nr:hypothetical protein B0H19DRAFT_1099093 [Mycena capillaripes]
MRILLGRSASRPLVRGESQMIALFRLIILGSLCLAIPVFGGYVVFVVPFQARVMTRDIKVAQPWSLSYPAGSQGNIIMLLRHFSPSSVASMTITRTYPGSIPQIWGDSNDIYTLSSPVDIMLSYSWEDLSPSDLIVSANFSDPSDILYVKLGQGEPSDVDSYAEAIPLLAGSHLSAVLSRKQRDLFSNNALDLFGVTTPFKSIILTPVLLMQQDPSPPDLRPNTASLRFHIYAR